jgi:hypothetical protein
MVTVPPEHEGARPGPSRTTGLQAADAILDAAISACETIMGPKELVVLLDVHQRRVARRLDRHGRWLGRLGLEEAA